MLACGRSIAIIGGETKRLLKMDKRTFHLSDAAAEQENRSVSGCMPQRCAAR
jgi:hypothetical protein